MHSTTLGRTGLIVSVAGLGGGGPSRLGLGTGKTEAEAIALIRRALDGGVTLIDTAASNGTEDVIGKAVAGRRHGIVLSTKAKLDKKGLFGPRLISAKDLIASVDASLRRLQTDYLDLLNLHSVLPEHLPHVRKELVPALLRLREAGKIRFIGISESFAKDPTHRMLSQSLGEDTWDVVLVGFNLLNASARRVVLDKTRATNTGVLCMYAVRRALRTPAALLDALAQAEERGEFRRSLLDAQDPLGFLLEHAASLAEAAYRFCRHEPGVSVVLTGTGDIAHLDDNLRAINGPPLPPAIIDRLTVLFGDIRTVTGN